MTTSITPEHRAENDTIQSVNSADSLAILVRRTVLPSPIVSPVTEKTTATSTGQLERLTDYAHDQGWSVENTYTDIASGLNEARRGLGSLLDDVRDADYGRILVTYDDRLTRFGFSYLEQYFECYGVTVTVIEDETDTSAQEALIAGSSGTCCGMQSLK